MSELPTLFSVAKTGKKMQWKIETKEDKIFKTFGYVDGKQRTIETSTSGKNKGKINETSDKTQAKTEAKAIWVKQLDKGYRVDEEDEEAVKIQEEVLLAKQENGGNNHGAFDQKKKTTKKIESFPLPILAMKYTDIMAPKKGKRRIEVFEFGFESVAQPKLDGVRCTARIVDGKVRLLSRKNKDLVFLNHIREEVSQILEGKEDIVLDGEVYVHKLKGNYTANSKFDLITACARTVRKTPHEMEEKMQYHIFDIVDLEKPYKERDEILLELFSDKEFSHLKLVQTKTVLCREDVEMRLEQWEKKGYEGAVLRDPRMMYLSGKRSPMLLKYKNFEDAEFEIVDVFEGDGTEKGACVFRLKTDKGKEFNCRPEGTMEERREIFSNKEEYIGKKISVVYQGTSEDGIPRFPVGRAIRDYED